MKIKFYSHGCPNCKILKKKLDEKNIDYEECNDIEEMKQKGFKSMPKLELLLDMQEALKWIKEQGDTNNEIK